MVEYGPESVGGVMGATTTFIFGLGAPSMLPSHQLEEGDKYWDGAQDLMDKYLDKLSNDTKILIKQQTRTYVVFNLTSSFTLTGDSECSMEDAKRRAMTSTRWSFGQSKASIYRQQAKALYTLVRASIYRLM